MERHSDILRSSTGFISSPRFRRTVVCVWCVLKVIVYAGIVFVFLAICRSVLHNQSVLQGTVQDLSNRIDALSAFIKNQQQTLLSLLSKFESSQDKNTRELVRSIKAVQQMSERQAVTNRGALEKKVGKAVIGLAQAVVPWPLLKILSSGYDLLTGLATRANKN